MNRYTKEGGQVHLNLFFSKSRVQLSLGAEKAGKAHRILSHCSKFAIVFA